MNPMDLYILARWFYKTGESLIEDRDFDELERVLRVMEPSNNIFNTSYTDDVEPLELLNKYNLASSDNPFGKIPEEYSEYLLEDVTKSIQPVRNLEEAYNWFKLRGTNEFIISLKVDGISVKCLVDAKLKCLVFATSKGSKTDAVHDFTYTVGKVLPKKFGNGVLEDNTKFFSFKMEAFVEDDTRESWNKKYGQSFVNGRTAALSAMTVGIPKEFQDGLKLLGFWSEQGNTCEESVNNLEYYGCNTVPYIVVNVDTESLKSFKESIYPVIETLIEVAKEEGIPYDGIVARINDNKLYDEEPVVGKYSKGEIALKLDDFFMDVYTTRVLDIKPEFEGSSKEFLTQKVYVEPIVLKDGKTLNKVTGYNPRYIIDKGIKIGSTVEISYVSGCYPTLL